MIWVGRLISIAVILQTIELFWVRPWNWKILAKEIPRVFRPLLKSNAFLLSLRLVAAVVALIFPHPLAIAVVWLTTWGVAVRWRGTFNGGSDAMTFLILTAWLVSAILPSSESIALLYIAIQLILSYLVAGIAKIVSPQWRNGQAPQYFLAMSGVAVTPEQAFVLAWVVLVFECLFPLAVFAPIPFLLFGLVFHLMNVYFFGLNRFVFAWVAAYPALLISVAHSPLLGL